MPRFASSILALSAVPYYARFYLDITLAIQIYIIF